MALIPKFIGMMFLSGNTISIILDKQLYDS